MNLIAGLFLGGLAVADLKYKKISVIPVIIMGVLLFFLRGLEGIRIPELVGGLLPGGGMLLLAYLSGEALGVGDGLVLFALGMGYQADKILVMLFVALVSAAVVSVVLLLLKKAGRKSEIPFLPFLFLGWLVGVMI